ncbi:hypothetical protein E4U30_005690 [Claviceps sp. LM220 group G6]|nr:hypothetical protein E4U30_005690 [Claviceps sp. LM220 group G6]
MGHKLRRHRSSSSSATRIDLLSAVFGIPSHWDIKRADQKFNDRVIHQHEDDSDDTTDGTSETTSTDTSTSLETSSSDRSAAPRPRASTVGSCRKRQQAHRRAASLDEKQRNTTCKDKGKRHTRSVKAAPQEQKLKRTRPQFRERNKTPKPAPAGRRSSPPVESQNGPKTPIRNYATFPPRPMMVPACQPPHQQIPIIRPHFAQPLHAPTVLPSVPQYPRSFGYQFAYPSVPPACEQRRPPVPDSNLLHLQQHLDKAQERLSRDSGNSRLQQNRSGAQQQLNKFLDVLVAENKRPSHPRNPKTAVNEDTSSKGNCSMNDEVKENVASDGKTAKPESGSPFSPQQQADGPARQATRSNTGAFRIRHHLCSGCGNVRSQQFHDINPISVAHSYKPMLNFCSACRETRFRQDMMDRYHFCFGCGRVRSKVFQEKFKARPGEPLLPNYCGSCTNEVRLMEDNNEASCLGAVIRESSSEEDPSAESVTPGSSSESSKCGNSPQWPATEAATKSGNVKDVPQLHLDKTSPVKGSESPVSPATTSPFYPGRRLGSAQRRAQRGPTPHAEEEHVAASAGLTENNEYRVPYVEEVLSDTGTSSEPALWDNMETHDSEARWTCAGEPYQGEGESFGPAFRSNEPSLASHERPKTSGKSHVSGAASSTSPEGQTWRARDQRQAQYEGLGIGYRQAYSTNTIPHSTRNNAEDYAHSRGVFGQRKNVRFEEPDEPTSRRRSPSPEFESHNGFRYFDDGQAHEESPQDFDCANPSDPIKFRSNRGAFAQFDMSSFRSAHAAHFGSVNSPATSDSRTTFGGHNHHHKGAEGKSTSSSSDHEETGASSFSSASSAGRANKSNKEQPPPKKTFARSIFSDYSRSTNENPYYTPRRRHFPFSYSEDAFRSSWDRYQRHQPPPTTRASGRTSFDANDRIPEPIVEEADSAPSSPISRTMLLEFKPATI